MNLSLARSLAVDLVSQHGLQNWRISFHNSKRVFGRCWLGKNLITLSSSLVHLNSEHEVRDTILHEIAHGLAWINDKHAGHGQPWRKWCVRIGAKPERCFTEKTVALPSPKYLLINFETKEVYSKYHKLPAWHRTAHIRHVRGKPETKGKLRFVYA